jgi:diguanylate cyclase (GGDEF)-like protein
MRIPGHHPASGLAGTPPLRVAAGTSAAGASSNAVRTAIADVQSILGIPASEFTPRVRDAIMKLMGDVEALRQELNHQRRRVTQLEAEADMDVLLPCFNRRAFVREMSRILSFVERYTIPASLIYLDLDNFKAINDTHGHAAGDSALRQICDIIKGTIRESDILGRIGGDEFGLILAKSNHAEAEKKADLLTQILKASPLVWNGKALPLAVTTGSYEFRTGTNVAEVLAGADSAMMARKNRKRTLSAV